MVRELITQPLRMAASTSRAGVHLAADAVAVGLTVTDRLIESAAPQPEQSGIQRPSLRVEVLAVPVNAPRADPPAERHAATSGAT